MWYFAIVFVCARTLVYCWLVFMWEYCGLLGVACLLVGFWDVGLIGLACLLYFDGVVCMFCLV